MATYTRAARDTVAPMTSKIRNAQDSDAAAVAGLLVQLGYPTTAEQVSARLRRLEAEGGHHVLVAVAGDAIVGLATVFIRHLIQTDAPLARIAALVVDDAWRSRGVGHDLVAATEAIARTAGCERIEVTSADRRTRAHDFYLRLGYED